MATRPAETVPPKAQPAFRFTASVAGAIETCWQKAAVPAEWNLSRDQFQIALERSFAHRFSGAPASADTKAIESYLETLHARDLALACACSAGSDAAWEFFVAQFRQDLYRAARAVAGDANSRELADSLYADLYGLRESRGQRKSLFDYFHGRSKLSTWLRAVLAQRHVDAIRSGRKMEPLEDAAGRERTEADSSARSSDPNDPPDPDRAKYLALMQATVTDALAALEARDRLRLAYYYADGRTLAEIGRLLGEHEATVSRKLERARKDVRRAVESALRDKRRLTDAQVRLCFEYAREEWPFDLTDRLHARFEARNVLEKGGE